MRRTHLASDLGIGKALAEYLRGYMIETQSIVSEFPQVVVENLFVQISEEMNSSTLM
jgi:hypothetical protein